MFGQLSLRREGAVAIIEFDYGDDGRALFGRLTAEALLAMIGVLDVDQACRAVILVGRGADFCPGGDCGERGPSDLIDARNRGRLATDLFRALSRASKPIVAAVEGRVVGVGLSLVALCDWVVAATDATFRSDAIQAGMLPDLGLLWSLSQRVGMARARQAMLSGMVIGGEEGRRIGIATEVAPSGEALALALTAAYRYGALPPVGVALAKAALFNGTRSFDRATRLELDLGPLARQSADHGEAIAAFLEKRPPSLT
ncbi:enoyl-CoA hydratase (plasmid) [Azospirillum sp. B510]|uniref:enoyl-CoA hydratase/isomerase family protein n=1 Tax=Azospirillum sp. (strain B510) TaxID=137722 RepID=UPI0001C4CC20|nr:enoyl-CoA hydratase/isomerase family protein [Azospirillum sp. B510]BAI74886.1 enoyl-CoA hydratase [Azospirillum sp. B510]